MQNRYFGDVGDYGKYGLLRALCGISPVAEPRLQLGIAWYLYPDEGHNADGKHVRYLDQPDRFESCDPGLYAWLQSSRAKGRDVSLLHESEIFPAGTVYVDESVGFGIHHHRERRAARSAWLERALAATADSDLVFCDPDNGIASDPLKLHRSKGGKHIGLDEIRRFHERGQTVVVYHHADRSADVPTQASVRVKQLRDAAGATEIHPVVFRRGSARFYFVLEAERHSQLLRERIDAFLDSAWGCHFKRPLAE